ncbi:transposase [Streptomyces sp. TLI_171]|uniref:transposase n=1 Tax=Streptomyces sp. TLI_171 TaxID=1938859 RepID=UPI000C1A5D12|nr:transposase [Streptomyces sp. TLI_171]RKE05148.1 transposase [Streptomyces sp. TLI_171]
MVAEVLADQPNESAALRAVAEKLGIGSPETLRNWVRRDQVDSGQRPGTATEEFGQIKAVKKETAELKRANEILEAAASLFAAERDRPHLRSSRSSTGTWAASAASSRSAAR